MCRLCGCGLDWRLCCSVLRLVVCAVLDLLVSCGFGTIVLLVGVIAYGVRWFGFGWAV